MKEAILQANGLHLTLEAVGDRVTFVVQIEGGTRWLSP